MSQAEVRGRRGFRTLTIIAAIVIPLLLAAMGVELAREFTRGRELRAALDHSYDTRAQIQSVFSLLQDGETGQRGYIITGNRRFLEPYDRAMRDLDAQLAALTRLFAAEPSQAPDLAELKRLTAAKRETLIAAIEARDERGAQAATALVSAGTGKAIMDDIRIVVDRMIKREAEALQARARLADERAASTERLVALTFAGLLGIVIAAAVLAWRYVTTRRTLLGEISAAAARQQAVFDSAIDAIITLNPSGSIESVNPAAVKMFGYSAADLDRRDISLLVELAGEGEAPFLTRLGATQGALEGGLTRELSARRRDGTVFPVDVALGAMELPTGVHVVAAVRDISERRRMEQMKDEFVSTVSHELRTPLTSIAGSLGLLAGGAAGPLPDRAARLIQIAQSNSQRLVRLINDILDVEKIESGKLVLDLAPLDLRDIAQRSIDGVHGYADAQQVGLSLLDGPPAPVRGDADRLIQVVTNLLSNALKFSPTGGEVRVAVDTEIRVARLSVVDQGPGVPDAFRSRIFSKFAQADGSDTKTKGGTGLGLAIAREIAERHGGRLWFESTPGEGATFHLDLPLASAVEAAADAHGPRLLIVEDDADAAQVLREMLEGDGFSADIAPTAREGLAMARTGGYAASLVDLQLPDSDGVTLIRALRADPATRAMPVVVVSADTARGKARGRSLEVVDWMEKPFDQERLRAAVTAIFARTLTRKPYVLHVDDDRDILEVTASALKTAAEVVGAESLAAARRSLAARRPDLVILDLGLPDGSGLELLADMTDAAGQTIPVIVYSAQEMDAAVGKRVEAVLTKSRTSLAGLARTVRRLTAKEQA